MVLFLTLLSGIAWTIVYIVSIRIGFTQKTYTIPLAALALNIAWESIHSVNGLITDRSVQTYINLAWGLADVVIVYTFFRYGRRELPRFVSRWMFIGWGIAVIAAAYVVHWLFITEFGWNAAARYTAFLQNALMSGLFIAMFVARRGPRGRVSLSAAPSGSAPLHPPSSSALSQGRGSSSGWASSAAPSTWPTSDCCSGPGRIRRYSMRRTWLSGSSKRRSPARRLGCRIVTW